MFDTISNRTYIRVECIPVFSVAYVYHGRKFASYPARRRIRGGSVASIYGENTASLHEGGAASMRRVYTTIMRGRSTSSMREESATSSDGGESATR